MHPSRLAKLGSGADPSKFQIPAANPIRTTPVAASGPEPVRKQNVQLTAPRNFDQPPPNVYDQSWSLGRGRGGGGPSSARKPIPSRPTGRGTMPTGHSRGSAPSRGPPPPSFRGPAPFRGSATFRGPPPPPSSFTPAKPTGPPAPSVVKSAAGIHPDRLKMLGIKSTPAANPSSAFSLQNTNASQHSASNSTFAQPSSNAGDRFDSSNVRRPSMDSQTDWRPAGHQSAQRPSAAAASHTSSNFNATHPPSKAPSYSNQMGGSDSFSNNAPTSFGNRQFHSGAQNQPLGQPSVPASSQHPPSRGSSERPPYPQTQYQPNPSTSQPTADFALAKQAEPYQPFGFVPFKLNGQSTSQPSTESKEHAYREEPVRQPVPSTDRAPVRETAAPVKVADVPNNWDGSASRSSPSSGWKSPPAQTADASMTQSRAATHDTATRVTSPPPTVSRSRPQPESSPAAQHQSPIRPLPDSQPSSQQRSQPESSAAARDVASKSSATAQSVSYVRSHVDAQKLSSNSDVAAKTRSVSDDITPSLNAKENAPAPTLTFESSSASYLPSDPAPLPTLTFANSASSLLPKQEPQQPVLKITAVFDRSSVVERRVTLQREGPKTASSLSSLFSSIDIRADDDTASVQEEWTPTSKSAYEWDSSEAASASSSHQKPVLTTRWSKVINAAAGWSAPPPPPKMAPSVPEPQPAPKRSDQWLVGAPVSRPNPAPRDDGGWSSSSPSPPHNSSSARNVYASANPKSPSQYAHNISDSSSAPAAASRLAPQKAPLSTPQKTPLPTSSTSASVSQPTRATYSTVTFGSSVSQPVPSSKTSAANKPTSMPQATGASKSASHNAASNNNPWASLSSPPQSASSASALSKTAPPNRPPVHQPPSYNGGWESDDEDEDPAQIVAQLQSVRKTSLAASFRV